MGTEFQSRNRGSFGFKLTNFCLVYQPLYCFNLVIEVLLVSRLKTGLNTTRISSFQSRNRGSFGFKVCRRSIPGTPARGRFQSRNRGSFDFKQLQTK